MKSWIEISAENLKHNLSVFKVLAKDKKVLFTVKANAYGHGLEEIISITKDLDTIEYYGVDSLKEALKVKKIDQKKKILILGWLDEDELPEAIMSGIEFVIPSINYLLKTERISSQIKKKSLVHLKIETGTSRLGILPEDLLEFFKNSRLENVLPKGIYSHFANIEDTTDHTFAMGQLKKFLDLMKKFDTGGMIRHFSCSASALLFPDTYFDMVRVGISAYGFWPSKQTYVSFLGKNGREIGLRPVLSWYSKVAQVKRLKRGTPVSYGLSYKTLGKSVIVVIPVGYYDGYDRKLSNISNVLIKGEIAPVRGRVCMNMFMSEVTHIANVKEGDVVTIIGSGNKEEINADGLAELSGTINYEFVSRLNPLIPRIVV